jgi:hypothetical protein
MLNFGVKVKGGKRKPSGAPIEPELAGFWKEGLLPFPPLYDPLPYFYYIK